MSAEEKTETCRFGDWAVCGPGCKGPEIGRVAEDKGESAYVCCHAGRTAAGAYKRGLRRAAEAETLAAPGGIGLRRFDPRCPIAKERPGLARCEALAKEGER